MTGDLNSQIHTQAKNQLPADNNLHANGEKGKAEEQTSITRGRSYCTVGPRIGQGKRRAVNLSKDHLRGALQAAADSEEVGDDASELRSNRNISATSHPTTADHTTVTEEPNQLRGQRSAERCAQHLKPLPKPPRMEKAHSETRIDQLRRLEAAKPPKKLGDFNTFNLTAVKSKIGLYEMGSKRPSLSTAGAEALYKGCTVSEGKRDEFLDKFHEQLSHIPPADNSKGRQPTTLLELFGGDKDLLELYKAAIKEEKNSVEFRDAVMTAAAEVQKDGNPCPGQKMVMYVGGASGTGKSHCRRKFVQRVKEFKQFQMDKNGTEPDKEDTAKKTYVVSVDGGIDRQYSQVRQIVLQAALAKGYSGISDLHKNTDTSVKEHVKNAAMMEGNNMHVVIPATFVAEAKQLIPQFRKLAGREEILQVFAEIRADEIDLTGLTDEEALESHKLTTLYNGVSRAYLEDDQEFTMDDLRINNRDIPCESKVYEPKYYMLGVNFSRSAKGFFKAMTNPRKGNALLLSNDSDNVHVKRDSETGRYVQTASNPDVKHVTRREIELYHVVAGFEKYRECTDLFLETRLRRFGLPEEKVQEMRDKILAGELNYYVDGKNSTGTKTKNLVTDLEGFLTFLGQNDARARLKITLQETW